MNSLATRTRRINLTGSILRRRLLALFICLLACSAGAAQAQESSQANAAGSQTSAASGGVISGRVTGEDGQPFASAMVSVYRMYAPGPGQGQNVGTDEDGKFLVPNLSPGLYSVSAFAPGLISQRGATTDEPQYHRVGDSVNLTLVKGGVITGTVRDANGEPVVAVAVNALRVRDANGHTVTYNGGFAQSMTDDRGIYRIYGQMPGTYLVSAGGRLGFSSGSNPYEGDAPTYYPSSTRDTAAEVSVRSGEEATNIDIRYRGEHGHMISGKINSTLPEGGISYGISITLRHAASGASELNNFFPPRDKAAFSIQGVADGVYDLIAQQGSSTGQTVVSSPRRVTVRGADVTGLELTLSPLGSVAGRAVLEPAPKKEGCEAGGRPPMLVEVVINARSAQKSQTETLPFSPFSQGGGGALNEQGEFTIRNLSAGSYRLGAWLPTDFWYLRSVALPAASVRASAPAAKNAETKNAATSSFINLTAGQTFTGVTVNIAQDGATLSGRVTEAKEGAEAAAGAPQNVKVYLVPAERERAEDLLRYAEMKPDADGAFSFKHLAPGRYWLIARPFVEDDSPDHAQRPLAWDADARAKLRKDAEAQNTAVELSPCKSVADQVLRYAAVK